MAAIKQGPLGGKPLLLVLGVGLALMLLASAAWRLSHPSLTVRNERAARAESAEAAGMPGGMPGGKPGAMPGGMGEVGQLMNRAAANPRDVEALTGIAERLLMMNAPEKAMVFVDRALAERPAEVHLLDLKAVALAGMDRAAEAQGYLEMALAKEPDNPRVRFHMGMLLKYALNKPEAAAEQLRKVRDSAGAPQDLRDQAAHELETPAAPAMPAAPAKP
jgi:predicted Zn-dependent protease